MNLIVQRFQPGDPHYSEANISNDDPEKGEVGVFKATFGQLLDDQGKFICYTLERRDTLITEGTRKFKFYYSPANKCTVPLFEDEPGSETFDRYLELHPANFAFQLKGCTAVGLAVGGNMLSGSQAAFGKVFKLLNGAEGNITHEKFNSVA